MHSSTLPILAASVLLIYSAQGAYINVRNNCPYTVWVGTLGNREQDGHQWSNPENGGFELGSGGSRGFGVEQYWRGRIWGRTNCNDQGQCETGNCWNGVQCQGQSGAIPASLAEFRFDSDGNDFYDASVLDGFNIPIAIGVPGGCPEANCNFDMNSQCPDRLRERRGDRTIGCNNPGKQDQEFIDYSHRVCPNAYAYPTDDSNTKACPSGNSYEVIFCQ